MRHCRMSRKISIGMPKEIFGPLSPTCSSTIYLENKEDLFSPLQNMSKQRLLRKIKQSRCPQYKDTIIRMHKVHFVVPFLMFRSVTSYDSLCDKRRFASFSFLFFFPFSSTNKHGIFAFPFSTDKLINCNGPPPCWG